MYFYCAYNPPARYLAAEMFLLWAKKINVGRVSMTSYGIHRIMTRLEGRYRLHFDLAHSVTETTKIEIKLPLVVA